MIFGAHVVVYSKDADADRTFLREKLGLKCIDAGYGWLIFGLPPAEMAVHPGENGRHELYLMCSDVQAEIAALRSKGVECSDVHDAPWGSITTIALPGGGKLGLYQPRHPMMVDVAD